MPRCAVCGDIAYDKIFTDTYASGYLMTADEKVGLTEAIISKKEGTDTTLCFSDKTVRANALELCQNAKSPRTKTTNFYYASTNTCRCSECVAAEKKYGCENAAYWTLVNEIAKAMAESGYKVNVLAYRYTDEVPSFKLESNVHVTLSNRTLCSAHAIDNKNCEKNYAWSQVVLAWTKAHNDIEVLDFTSDYNYYPATFPSLETMRLNMKFYAKAGVESVSMQWSANAVDREIGNVRAMLFEYLVNDPNMSASTYNKIVKWAFTEWFGEGGQYIYEWYNLYAAEATGHFDVYTRPDELVPVTYTVGEDGQNEYDMTLIRKGYVLFQKAHPFAGETLAKNRSNIAKMLCTTYDNNNTGHALHQFSRWLNWNIPAYDGTRVLKPLVDEYYNR